MNAWPRPSKASCKAIVPLKIGPPEAQKFSCTPAPKTLLMRNTYPLVHVLGIMSYTLFVFADPQDAFRIPLFATFPSKFCRSQTEGSMREHRVRHLRHFYPVAGLRHWISQKFPFLDGNGDINDSKRTIYDSAKQNRWKNAINQIGTGTGLTEDEKAEAARIRRAKLVAQDPQYTQRLFGSSAPAGNNRQSQPVCPSF